MHLKRVFWLALLLPQFALLLFFVYDDLRELRYELQFHEARPMGCIGMPSFSALQFGFTVLGLSAVIGLCGRRWWSPFLYAVFALGLLAATLPDTLGRPIGSDSFLLVQMAVLATLPLGFWRCSRPLPLSAT